MHIHLCTVIDCTADEVWSSVEDISTHTEWMADADSITFVTDQRQGVGTEFECLTRVGPLVTTDVMTITEWQPGRRMGIEHRGVVTGRGHFNLEDDGRGRTIFCWDEDLHFPWWMGSRAGERAGRPILERIWRANLTRLKAKAEREAAAARLDARAASDATGEEADAEVRATA